MNQHDDAAVVLAPLEEAMFGHRAARAMGVTADNLPKVLDFCLSERVRFLIARCPVADLQAVQAMEKRGFFLTDTLVYHRRNLRRPIPPCTSPAEIRPLRDGEIAQVSGVASEAFHGYLGHYHADANLDQAKCDEAYVSWAVHACHHRDADHEVLVALQDGAIGAFSVVRMNGAHEAEGVLCGVAQQARRLKIYTDLIIESMNWGLRNQGTELIISTQIQNAVAQRVWASLGFEFLKAYYTFHCWLNP